MVQRDSQRSAVYKWERRVAAVEMLRGNDEMARPLTLDECRELVARVWEDYRGPQSEPPEVVDGRGRRKASGSRWQISLPRWARKPVTVLHEIGHALEDANYTDEAWHGPKFARLVVDLWAHYANADPDKAYSMGVCQRPRRVRFCGRGECAQPLGSEIAALIAKREDICKQRRKLDAELIEINRQLRTGDVGR